MVTAFIALHDKGNPADVVARAIARALAVPRPRARDLAGRNSRRMAVMAAALPTPGGVATGPPPDHPPARPGVTRRLPQPADAALARRGRRRWPLAAGADLAVGDGRVRCLAQMAIRHADDHRSEIDRRWPPGPPGGADPPRTGRPPVA